MNEIATAFSNAVEAERSEIDDSTDEDSCFVWPVLDQIAFSSFAREFCDRIIPNNEGDPAAILVQFLAWFGIQCGCEPKLSVGDTWHPPRILVVIVGATSKARKGTSIAPIRRLQNERKLSPEILPLSQWSDGPLSTGEGLIYAVRDPVVKQKEENGEVVEEVVDIGVDDKRLFVCEEEFASALTVMKREGNTLSALIRSAWDNGNITPLTKNNRIQATGAHIGIAGHITLEELDRKMDETECFNGFANRFLWVCAKRSKIIPFPKSMNGEEIFHFQNRLREILDVVRNIRDVGFSPVFKEKWREVYHKMSEEETSVVLGAVTDRGPAQVLRLALIYALMDKRDEIGVEHLEPALAVWRYCEQSARFIFSRPQNQNAEKILRALRTGPMTKTEISSKVFKRNLKAAEIGNVIKGLIASGKIIDEKEPKRKGEGRPSTRYMLRN